ncbi:MAG TPA: tripartite tricarboxylate transporter TctB family protein [Methylomirabilota bacterium]|nr:tripartite tricarboxylate transporter TctB family protein [Methylomirabilota bacterium]
MRRADQIAGAGLLLLGLGFAVAGLRSYTYWSPTGPGSGFLPFWLGLTMMLLAGSLLVRSTRGGGLDVAWLPTGRGRRKLLAVLGVTVALVAVLKVTGMAVGTVLFLVAILRLVEGLRWSSTLAIAVGTAAANYLIFARWLRVPFPEGVLGF